MQETNSRYYLTEVDKYQDSIYCNHQEIGEKYILEHEHKKSQFLYTEGGIVYVKINTTTYFLPARHFMWIPSNVTHAIYPNSPEVVMRNIYFPFVEEEQPFYNQIGIYMANDLILEVLKFVEYLHDDIMPSNVNEYKVLEGFKAILPLIDSQSLPFSLPMPTNDRLKKIIEHLQNNMDAQLLFRNIAAQFGFSERNLNRLFQKEFGLTFIQYFTQLRIFKALELLAENKYSISEIATLCGYSSLPTFSNTFCKVTGIRPTDYQNKKKLRNI